MYYLFILIMFGAIGYFLFAKRNFDFFSIAILGGSFYFLPGLFGYAYNPYLNILDPLTTTQYEIFIAYFAFFSVGAMLKDRLSLKKEELIVTHKDNDINDKLNDPLEFFASIILGLIYVSSFLYLIYSLGGNAFSSDKLAIMSQLGAEFSVFCSSALIGVVFWYKKYKVLFMLAVLGLLYTLFISYRFIFILGLLSLITLYLSRQDKQRLFLKNWRVLVFIGAIGVFLLTYEYMYVSYKTFSADVIIQNVIINIHNYQRLFTHSEPMVIQENLNLVLKNNYHVSAKYLLNNLILFFVPFSSKMGLQAISFNQLFQPIFYSGYQYGAAANIWAEMFAVGGLKLVYSFMLLLAGLCFAMSLKIKQLSHNVAALVIPIGIIIFFYVQRNDLTFTLNMARNVFLIWGFINLVSYCLVKIKLKISNRK